jgi:hypothetical protein
VSWALLVMMLMTPLTAFAPQSVAPGPANDLDAINVFQRHVLHIPENSRRSLAYKWCGHQ